MGDGGLVDDGAAVRAHARDRATIVVAENEPQLTDLVREESAGGMGLDALWNDDFHHAAMVALNGRREAYYSDTAGTAAEFIAALKPPEGWRLDEPRLVSVDKATRVNIELRKASP